MREGGKPTCRYAVHFLEPIFWCSRVRATFRKVRAQHARTPDVSTRQNNTQLPEEGNERERKELVRRPTTIFFLHLTLAGNFGELFGRSLPARLPNIYYCRRFPRGRNVPRAGRGERREISIESTKREKLALSFCLGGRLLPERVTAFCLALVPTSRTKEPWASREY